MDFFIYNFSQLPDYLQVKVTKLIMIIPSSHYVFSMVDNELFKTTWKSRNVWIEFLEQITSLDDSTMFPDFLQTDYPTTSFEEAYRQYIEEVSIVMYGLGDTDLTLMVPMRHSGSFWHYPVLAHHKVEEIFLVASCPNILAMIVRRQLNNGEERPNEHDALLEWLQDIHAEYNNFTSAKRFAHKIK